MIEDAVIGADTFVGPYGRVRPDSTIGDSVQIGNFVEIKNSDIGSGSRINHLSFIGDASLEKDVTIGAGSITCNHNGMEVSQIQIRAGAYIGSGSQLVAPLLIGENATIGAGSTITHDAPAEKLTLARSRQFTIENWVRPDKKQVKNDSN
jgi:bifunctional UDP-N-acetylglucosamine pyrophosphorylase/glucosamine-1-phosphate N-acetyltransferase